MKAPTRRIIAALAALLSSGVALAAQDYAALSKWPDFTGFWIESRGAPGAAPAANPAGQGVAPAGPPGGFTGGAPLKPALAKRLADMNAPGFDPGGRERYCSPFGFAGNNASLTGFDLVYSPGRLTLINEEGLIRRIYVGRTFPKDAVDSLGGTSIAHWEGSTLVVETAYIDPQSKFPMAVIAGSAPIGKDARITEWFSMKGKKLTIKMTMIAPDLLTAPFTTTRSYQRDDAHWPIQRTSCVDNDRQIDPVTGKQRFDLTPPADLPPPPAN